MPGIDSKNLLENSSYEVFPDNQGNSTSESSNHIGKSNIKACKRGRPTSTKPCPNKNAELARQYRSKKRKNDEKLQDELNTIRSEKESLLNVIKQQNQQLKQLSDEVTFLRAAMKNNTSIASLPMTINPVPSEEKSIVQRLDHPYALAPNPKDVPNFQGAEDRPSYSERISLLTDMNPLPELVDLDLPPVFDDDNMTNDLSDGAALGAGAGLWQDDSRMAENQAVIHQ